MELLKSPMQRELEGVVQRLLQDKNAFTDLQQRLASGRVFHRELWSTLAELGLLCVPFSEDLGGTGGGFADVAAVAEALGKGLCLEPYSTNVVLCGSLLEDYPSLLAEMLCGEKLLAFAHTEQVAQEELTHIDTRAESRDGAYLLNGRKVHVFGGHVADRFVVSARTAGDAGDASGISLFLVNVGDPGVALKTYTNQDTTGAAELVLQDAVAQLVGPPGDALPAIRRALDRATAAICAEAVGAMEALVEATVDYVKTRKQFGTTLGSFQVVQHQAVDMLVELEHARSLTLAAGGYADNDNELERGRVISAAKIGVNEAARFVAKTALQLHGGIGMTEECAVGHYFRRLTAIRLSFGDTYDHLERLEALAAGAQA